MQLIRNGSRHNLLVGGSWSIGQFGSLGVTIGGFEYIIRPVSAFRTTGF